MKERLANFVFWFHIAWILMMISGVLWKEYRHIHLYLIIGTIASQIVFMGCPLVLLESKIRGDGNMGSFTTYCIERWLGVKINEWWVTGGLVSIFAGAVYLQTIAS